MQKLYLNLILGAGAFLLFQAPVFGQNRITCSSNNGKRNYCNVNTNGGVRLVRQLSGPPCDQGRSWGYDRQGIWVDRGCRAEFAVGNGGGGGNGWNNGGGNNWGGNGRKSIITCSSTDGKRHWCSADTDHYPVRFVRQISGQCRQGSTWGKDSGSVWVDRGCTAQFEVVVP